MTMTDRRIETKDDDGEPITWEWLESIGFVDEKDGSGLVFFDKTNHDRGHMNYWCYPDDGTHVDWSIQEERLPACLWPTNRGELRWLCRKAKIDIGGES